MPDESITPPSTSDNSLNPGIYCFDNSRIRLKFHGNWLKREKVTFTHKQVGNTYIFYEINLLQFRVNQDFTLANSLFGAFKLS